ncbi:MAG: sugar diacid recognition domain-containing protein [Bacillota bacterium]|nr:sugar diacid recognition domain-containing protein [Bacillota bacterium]
MKITPDIAQSIVERTMKLLNYNINIMDEKGIIVGSGDSSRLNTYHRGAEKVLKENKEVIISTDNLGELAGSRPGVNLPIRFDGEVVGVVGITGNPNNVSTYGAMVQAMAELMLEQSFYWQEANIIEQSRFFLLNDLIRRDPGKDRNILYMRASMLGYNLDLPRAVVVFEANKPNGLEGFPNQQKEGTTIDSKGKEIVINTLTLDSQDIIAFGIGNRYVLLKHIAEGKNQVINSIFDKFNKFQFEVTAGVGKVSYSYEEIPDAFDQALRTLEAGRRLFGPGAIYFTENLGLETMVGKLGKNFRQSYYKDTLKDLIEEGGNSSQLLETAKTFLDCSLKPGEAAQKLFIHRNTLGYRLGKIKEKVGLDLNILEDVMKFKMALLCWQFEKSDL